MAALEPVIDQDELFLDGLGELEWIDDVTRYKCTRCQKVLVQHYIANCDHKFCDNCKRLVDDGSQRWRCPRCNEFIKEIGRQDDEFRGRVRDLRLHCPNFKYGCQHICSFKQLKEHLERCKDTRENILPVPLEGEPMPDMLVEVRQLRWEMKEMKQRMTVEIEKMCRHGQVDEEQKGVNESAWELNIVVNEMKRVMEDMRKKQKDGNLKLKTKFFLINDRIDRVKLDQEKTINEISKVQEKKWAETNNKVSGVVHSINEEEMRRKEAISSVHNNYSSQINNLDEKVENFKRDLRDNLLNQSQCRSDLSHCSTQINTVNVEAKELQKKVKKLKAEVDSVKKSCSSETNWKMLGLFLTIIAIMIPLLGIWSEKKLSECATNIKKLEESMEENKLLIESINSRLEQKVFHLEIYNQMQNPAMNAFILSNDNHNFQPDLIWTISGIREKVKQETFEIKSEVFQWSGYPVQAEAKMEVKQDGLVWMSLCLKEINEEEAADIKPIPSVYYVLRDQSGNRDTKHWSRSVYYLFSFNYGPTFELLLTHKSWLTDSVYNVDDSIVVEVYVEPPSMVQQVYSYDGTLNWAIDNYHKRKEMAKTRLVDYQESPYFYTAPNRFRVQVRMHLDGWGEYRRKGLTAQISFLTGEFDDDLPLTFPHETTVTIFNRKYPQRNITKTVHKDIQTEQNYFINVCSDEEIENVIENDTLFYQVSIKLSN